MLAVIAHDAGGAEVLSSYVRREGLTCWYVLEGPARGIFERKLGPIDTVSLDEAIRRSTSILCGTSWQSDLEVNAIRLARARAKPSTAFLEHWVHYRERFTRAGETTLPDEIWTGDAFAQTLATEAFPGVPVRLVENPYFEDIRQELAAMPRQQSDRPTGAMSVLYVCEPLREHGRLMFGNERHWGYVEDEALVHFLRNVHILGRPVQCIVIRPHPSEPADKYDWVQRQFDLPIVTSAAPPLLQQVVDCDVVVGCQSTAMVVGLLAGKRVISCIPPGGAACSLPFPEIEHWQCG